MVDRTVAPAFVAPKIFKLPQPDLVHLSNGSRFLFLNAGDQPVVKLEFIFKAGSWFEPKPGVAFFTGKMLSEGTASFNSKAISEFFDQYGAFVEVRPGYDYINLLIHIPTRHFSKLASVLQEMLFQPTFPDHELELMKEIQIQHLSINEQKNSFVASRVFRSKLYGDDFPYGNVMDKANIHDLEVDVLKTYFNHFIKGKFDLFVTGRFDAAFQKNILVWFEKNLQNSHEFLPKDPTAQNRFEEYIEKNDSLQSTIVMGKRSVNRNHEMYGSILLLNEVFGGYFGSRLMQNIREDKGLTYSIYSHMVTMKNDAYFIINSDVEKSNKDQAVEEIHFEIEKLKNELVGNEELIQVKNYLKGSLLNSLTSPFAISEKLKNIYFYDLGTDYYEAIFNQIDQTTNEDLIKLANDILFNKPLSQVVVG